MYSAYIFYRDVKEIKFSYHSIRMIHHRFKKIWFGKKQVVRDIKHNIENIMIDKYGRSFRIEWQIWYYIMWRDWTIITCMIKDEARKKSSANRLYEYTRPPKEKRVYIILEILKRYWIYPKIHISKSNLPTDNTNDWFSIQWDLASGIW